MYPPSIRPVSVQPLGIPSFSTAIVSLATAASATDIVTISGATGSIITIQRIIISGVATAAAAMPVEFIRRITLDTGGTATNPLPVPRDGSFKAAAVIAAYTVNPGALGTFTAPGGVMHVQNISLGTLTAPAGASTISLAENGMTPPVLRSATDQFAINLLGVTYTGSAINITIEHQEQAAA